MTAPHDPEVARVWRSLDPALSLLADGAGRMRAESFVATHQTGTVEAAVNAHMRLVGLNINPRILTLGPAEVAGYINETISAAIDYAAESVGHDVTELTGQVTESLAEVSHPPPPA